jgi:hypothetical protein
MGNCDFAVGYVIVLKMSGARHYKPLVAININLRHLVRSECVLNRKRMKPIVLLKLRKLSFRRLEQSDPDKSSISQRHRRASRMKHKFHVSPVVPSI